MKQPVLARIAQSQAERKLRSAIGQTKGTFLCRDTAIGRSVAAATGCNAMGNFWTRLMPAMVNRGFLPATGIALAVLIAILCLDRFDFGIKLPGRVARNTGRPERLAGAGGSHVVVAETKPAPTLEQERAEFYRQHDLDPSVVLYPPDVPAPFLFWANRLESDSADKAEEAFLKFVEVAQTSIHRLPSADFGSDVNGIHSVAFMNFTYFETREDVIGQPGVRPLTGIPQINVIISACMKRLSDPARETDALKVLNLFTLNVYDGKEAQWWLNHFQHSKLRAILDGRPRHEWVDLPE